MRSLSFVFLSESLDDFLGSEYVALPVNVFFNVFFCIFVLYNVAVHLI